MVLQINTCFLLCFHKEGRLEPASGNEQRVVTLPKGYAGELNKEAGKLNNTAGKLNNVAGQAGKIVADKLNKVAGKLNKVAGKLNKVGRAS